MNEIYWLTRLDSIVGFLYFATIVGLIACVLSFAVSIQTDTYEDETVKKARRIFKKSLIVSVMACVINIFTPSTKEAFVIYGVGSTIDFVKSNDKAKQLPGKVVDALDKYVESLSDSTK